MVIGAPVLLILILVAIWQRKKLKGWVFWFGALLGIALSVGTPLGAKIYDSLGSMSQTVLTSAGHTVDDILQRGAAK